MAFDKTGTLTRGTPKVVGVFPLNDHSEEELLERAAALEARSAHPLARAVSAHAVERGIAVRAASDVQVLQGKGVTGIVAGGPFWPGSHRHVIGRGQDSPEDRRGGGQGKRV